MTSKVYFAPVRSIKKRSMIARVATLLERAGLKDAIAEGDLVAVKLHFGEKGNTGFVHPVFVRETVTRIKQHGGKPFLTDANTLYSGMRANAVDHLQCAIQNGFSYATVDAPIVIADGIAAVDAVGDDDRRIHRGVGESVLDRALQVVDRVRAHAAVQGVRVRQERLAAVLLDPRHGLADEDRVDEPGVALLTEVQLHGDQVALGDRVLEARPLEQRRDARDHRALLDRSDRCEVDLGCHQWMPSRESWSSNASAAAPATPAS